jgi:type I restriction enzyme S subunit
MSEWVEGVLSDIAEIVMGQSPDGESCSDNTDDTPLLNGPTEFGIKYPIPVQFTDNPKRFSREEDILFCVRGSTGRMNWANQAYAIGRGLAAIRHKEGIDYKYFVRGIIDFNLPLLLSSATGSTFPNISRSQLENLEISLPPLPEQKAIAAVLSSLDDKIDLLHRQNKTLEAMAETLFRQWFIEEAKEDWEEKPLADIVKVIDNRGKTPPYQEYPTAFPIIEVNALCNTNRMVNYSVIRKYVSEETYETWFRGHPKKYDILISTVGSIGELSMYLIDLGCVAQNVVALSPRGISPFYLYQSLYNLKGEIKELDIGSVQPSIKVPHLLSIMIKIPPLELLDNYDEQAKRFVSKITNNSLQIQTLEKLRDNLLPKLMSGEVRVSYEQQDAA